MSNTRRMIKLLMAEGVQRNDAVAFVKAYHKVKDKSVVRQFPELIVPPPMPISTKTIYPETCAAQHVVSKMDLRLWSIDYDRYIKHKLLEKMAHGLVSRGFILFENKEYAADVVFTAKLRVLPPETVEAYTLGNWDNPSHK